MTIILVRSPIDPLDFFRSLAHCHADLASLDVHYVYVPCSFKLFELGIMKRFADRRVTDNMIEANLVDGKIVG